MFKEKLLKTDPHSENFGSRNPIIWTAYTCTINMLCIPPWEKQQEAADFGYSPKNVLREVISLLARKSTSHSHSQHKKQKHSDE